jgi:pilus assembly protein CpaB
LRSRLLAIVLAALLAVFGAVAVLAYVRQANERAIAGLKTVDVIAAKGTISPRTSLGEAQREGLLTTETLPESSVPGDALRSTTGLSGLVFSAAVQPAQLLLRPMLVPATQSAAASVLPIPAGMVAVTVQMCVQEAVADYITAGSDVAVFDTYVTAKATQPSRTCDVAHQGYPPPVMATHIVLTRVSVLAIAASPAATGTSAGSASTVTDPTSTDVQGSVLVTLAVDQADAEKLISIDELGLPYMALLTPDSKTSYDNLANPTNLFQP